jgi:hypothetical protein
VREEGERARGRFGVGGGAFGVDRRSQRADQLLAVDPWKGDARLDECCRCYSG